MDKQGELIRVLVEKGVISREIAEGVLDEAARIGKEVELLLVDKGIVDLENITEAKAKIYGLGYQNLSEKKVRSDILNVISFESAENYKIVCFDNTDNIIKVGITNPDDFKAIEAVNFLVKKEGYKVEFFLISKNSFDKVFRQYKNFEKEISTALESKALEDAGSAKGERAEEERGNLDEMIKSAPVAKIVSVLIRHAVEGRASDIHIEPSQNESRIRYRIDGVLHTSLVLPKNVHSSIVSRIKVLANLKLDETRIPQDGRIRLTINGSDIDFRVSILPLVGEEKVVMRILDTTKGAPGLVELGYGGRALRVILEAIKETSGMFLVTGPTGSGKSTTLFSILNMLNKEGVNISTLEDPVEYFIKGVNQSQIRPEIGFTFASGLRAFLRQDPDIIMVGEIRDNETAELAIHAGLTGHFVLSTLHTNSSVGTIPRLVDMKVEPFLLGSTLNTIVAQRLARKICPHCKEIEYIPEDVLEIVERHIQSIPKSIVKEEMGDEYVNKSVSELTFFKGKGCARCGGTGYGGRVAIVEVLDINDTLKKMIMMNNEIVDMEKVRASQDFTTMIQDGIIKAVKGFTTMEEVLRVMRD